MYSKNWEEKVLYKLASEYLSKCAVCDECCAEYYCITNQLKTSRTPQDDCPNKLIEYLKAQYKKTHSASFLFTTLFSWLFLWARTSLALSHCLRPPINNYNY